MISKTDLTVMIYMLVVSCGSPMVYLLGMEENRKKTKEMFRSKIEVFEKKKKQEVILEKTTKSKAKRELNEPPFPIVNGWI